MSDQTTVHPPDELRAMASQIAMRHGDVSRVASFATLMRSLIESVGKTQRINPDPLIDIGRSCVLAHCQLSGISTERLYSAMRDIELAGQTMSYLSSIPD